MLFEKRGKEGSRKHATSLPSEGVGSPRTAAMALDQAEACLGAHHPAKSHRVATGRSVRDNQEQFGRTDFGDDLSHVVKVDMEAVVEECIARQLMVVLVHYHLIRYMDLQIEL